MRPYYEHGGITIYHGDCREILPQLPMMDAVFCDPPYGVAKADWDMKYWADWMVPAAERAELVLAVTPGIANLPLLPFNVGAMVYRWMMSVRVLNGMTRGAMGFGNWIACALYARPMVGVCTSSQDATEVVIDGIKSEHPSPKPLAAMQWIVDRIPGHSICDPCCGSGTTLLAAKKRGRPAVGIEISEPYCEIAAKRLSQEVLDFGNQPCNSVSVGTPETLDEPNLAVQGRLEKGERG